MVSGSPRVAIHREAGLLQTFGASASYQQHGLKYARTHGIDISRLYEEIDGAPQ